MTSTDPGTQGTPVILSRQEPVPTSDTWRAITDPIHVARWFADADRPLLRPGDKVRLSFGDGDWFDALVDSAEPAHRLELRWRFLGIGPVSWIRWQLRDLPGGRSEITVIDTGGYDPPAAAELTEGWADFLARLEEYLATGRTTRYEWRGEIDASIDLPPDARYLLEDDDLVLAWLPVATDGFHPRWFFIVDDAGPRRFEIVGWRHDHRDHRELRFRVLVPEATAPTNVTVRTKVTDSGVRLSVHHNGWRELGLNDAHARDLRVRFADCWVAALRTAAERYAAPSQADDRW